MSDQVTLSRDLAEKARDLLASNGDRMLAQLLDDALAASPSVTAGWRIIESAPKDGTRILLGRFVKGCAHKKDGYIRVDFYRQSHDGAGYLGWGLFNMEYWPPTHWQPLPAPPLPSREK